MDLAFEDRIIREICEKESIAQAKYGVAVAASLKARLSDLMAAEWIGEIIVGQPTAFFDESEPRYKINLKSDYFLVLSCAHTKIPLVDGSINWRKVRKIKILQIKK